jgi:hypothetical protein
MLKVNVTAWSLSAVEGLKSGAICDTFFSSSSFQHHIYKSA